jgi:RHS repeat-associated protein
LIKQTRYATSIAMYNTHNDKPSRSALIHKVLCMCALLLLLSNSVHGQSSSSNPLDGFTPAGLQVGSPTGSFPLSGFDTVNPYNGHLNFSLPLLKVGGRGGAGYTLQQSINTKWTVTYSRVDSPQGQSWESWDPYPFDDEFMSPAYSAGALVARQANEGVMGCYNDVYNGTVWFPIHSLTRLTFAGPDGTSYEFRDQLLEGAPANVPYCPSTSANRGKIFTTTDGQSATFISDDDIYDSIMQGSAQWSYPSGYIKLRDGTVYRIDEGNVTWIRDRNGNKLSFTYYSYRPTSITDSLNRQITIDYDVNDPTYGLCNRISYKGFGGAQRTIWVTLGSLSSALRPGYSTQTVASLFPEFLGASTYPFNPTVPTGVWLPNGQRYKFYYNSYGEIARVELPTGGAYEYDWGAGLTGGPASGATCYSCQPSEIYRRILERRVYSDGGSGAGYESKMTFSRPESYGGGNLGYVIVNQYNSSETLLTSEKHYYLGGAFASLLLAYNPTNYSPWEEGKEYQTDVFASDGTTLLRTASTSWSQRTHVSWFTGSAYDEPSADPVITSTSTSLADTNQVSQRSFSYDQYNNQTDVYESDYGAGTPGGWIRHTHTAYLTTNPVNGIDYTSNSIHIRNFPIQRSVYDGGGTERARASFEYDNYVSDSNHAGLIPRANISGLDSAFNTNYKPRGNATGTTSYLLSGGLVTGSISAYSQYDIAGNLVKSIDGRGYATTLEYDDRYGTPDGEARSNPGPTDLGGLTSYAFATKVTNPQGQISYGQLDYYLSQPVNGEDINGIVASGYYNDLLDRPTQVRRAVNTTLQNQTTFAYDDANHLITTSSDRDTNDDKVLVNKVLYDPMGRTIEKRMYEGGTNYTVVQTQYDALGRAYKTSNPFRPWQSETAVWTTQIFDSLGRFISVTTPDNASVNTSYNGNSVTVTDQAGKRRKSVTDALGRLIQVYEDPSPENPSGLNYQTAYSYDSLDNLTKVTQGSQQRYFMYDSLKRLIRSRNPEQDAYSGLNLSDPITGNSAWSAGYQYDAAGNLTQKTDPRGVVSTYVYDALNRNTTVDYSDTPSINPDVSRFYDGATNGKGRSWYNYSGGNFSTGNNVEHTAIDSYDALGRPLVMRQLSKLNGTWSTTYQTSRTYNLAGGVINQTYPSGHTVTYNYDSAGRTGSLGGNLGDGTSRTYTTGISYSAFGGLNQEQFGTATPLYHKLHYNVRGQLNDIRLSTVAWATDQWNWNRGAIVNYYATADLTCPTSECRINSGADNNGNLIQSQHWIPANDQMSSYNWTEDRYTYDSLNSLKSVAEYHGGMGGLSGQDFTQMYDYDRFGNRTINQAGTTQTTGVNRLSTAISQATNRLYAPGETDQNHPSFNYDPAGNQIRDYYTSGSYDRTYDAENRMIGAALTYSGGSQLSTYTYDADGHRVRRKTGAAETWQIYGMDGELLAEYPANGAAGTPQKEYGYRNGQLLVTATAASSNGTNVALAANGGTAVASSTTAPYVASYVNDGSRKAVNGAIWADSTYHAFPDWIEVDFNSSKTISEIDVVTQQDDNQNPVEPTLTQTFSLYGNTAFDVQYWDGSSWATIPGGTVTGNNKVWRQFTFSSITTSKIRVVVNDGIDHVVSRVVEVEAWTAASGGSPANINWLVTDQLGTPRMVVDQTGSLAGVKRHDYLPFGEELFGGPANQPGPGGRTTTQGYSGGDGVRQQFTLKERDIETGLDYFGARYFASVQGRFSSPDPLLASGNVRSPQSWNRYSYVGNNPLAYIDPDGMLGVPLDDDEEQRRQQQQQQQQQRTVYVFVTFTQAEQQTQITNSRGATVGTAPGPNFQSLVDNAPRGTNVQLIQGENATVQGFTNALQDPNAAGVIFIGHGADDAYPATPFTADGINFGLAPETRETFDPEQPVQVRAQTVGIFACDSQAIAGSFQMSGSQALIGVNSSRDGVTSMPALSHAGFAAAQQLMRGNGPDRATAAANGALTLRDRSGALLARQPIDRGDTIRRIR